MSTVTCSICGTESAAGKKFCAECGAPLSLICPACGNPVTGDQKFCGDCGAALSQPVLMPEMIGRRSVTSPSSATMEEERRLVVASLHTPVVRYSSRPPTSVAAVRSFSPFRLAY